MSTAMAKSQQSQRLQTQSIRESGKTPQSNEAILSSLQRLVNVAASHHGGTDVVIAILDGSAKALEGRQSYGAGLTNDQAKYLVESGAMTQEAFDEAEAEVADGKLAADERATAITAIAESLSTEDVAKHLGIDETRVRHRRGSKLLYSFLVNRKLRFPAWQFVDSPDIPTLPGLSDIVKAIPEGMHPATVLGFMTTPQSTLRIDGEKQTPVAWLLNGGDSKGVVTILQGFLQT